MKEESKWWSTPGTGIILLDPGSGEELHEMVKYFRSRSASCTPLQIYQMCLAQYDPKGTLESCTELPNYPLTCPFCKKDKALRVTCTDVGEDYWMCHNCGEAGNSHRLDFLLGDRGYRQRLRELRDEMPMQNTVHLTLDAEVEAEMEQDV